MRLLLCDYLRKNSWEWLNCTLVSAAGAVTQAVVLPVLLGWNLYQIGAEPGHLPVDLLFIFFGMVVFSELLMLLRRYLLCRQRRNWEVFLQNSCIRMFWKGNNGYSVDSRKTAALFRESIPQLCGDQLRLYEQLVQLVFVIAAGSIMGIYLNAAVYGAACFLVLTTVLIMRKRLGSLQAKQKAFTDISREVSDRTWEQIQNHEIEGFLNPERMLAGYQRKNAELLDRLFSLKKTGNIFPAGALLMPLFLMLCAAGGGGMLVLAGKASLQEVYPLLFLLPGVARECCKIPELAGDLGKLNGQIEFLEQTLQNTEKGISSEERNDSVTEDCEAWKGLKLQAVSFGYPGSEVLFSDVSLWFHPGEYWSVTGENGCGKSTLLKIMAGILDADTGECRLDGIPMRKGRRKDWWRQISYLDQKPRFIKGSICDNIVMGEPFGEDRLIQAIKEADLERLIAQLPEGLNASVEDLSAGERQKVCFARAFYRNRKVLLLDEATSALDEEAEQRICHILQKKAENGWLIIGVAHRKPFAELADRHLVFRKRQKRFAEESQIENEEGAV